MSRGLSARRRRPSSRADAGGVGAVAGQGAAEQEGAVRARHQAGEVQLAARQQPGMAADRRAAGAVQLAQQRPLGGGDRARLGVLDAGQQLAQLGVVGARR